MKKTCSLCNFIFLISILSLPKNLFSQNVGIGTATPTRAKLEVHGAAGSTSAIFGGESTGMSVQRNYPALGFNQYYSGVNKYMSDGFAVTQYLDPESGYLIFDMFPNGTKDATIATYNRGPVIASDGNIGIRTNPISASLYVKKAGNFSGSVIFGGSLNNSHFHYGATEDTYIRGGKNASRVFFNDLGGGKISLGNGSAHVSINNGIPAYPLEVREVNETGLRLIQSSTNSNSWEMRVEITPVPNPEFHPDLNLLYNGFYKGGFGWGSGVYYTYSDKRLKTNIQDIPSTLEKYMKLEPVEYEMKYSNPNHIKTIGFVAQDVQKLFPQLVAITSSRQGYPGIDGLYGLDYNGFRMLTIKALQEQQQKIKDMQKQNAALTKRIAAAEKLLAGQ